MVAIRDQIMKDTKGRILFIDDDQDTRNMVRTLLGYAGYEAVSASSVTEGLRLAKNKSFDLILLDWHFEDGTGLELCQMIRAFDSQTPIFFYTGVTYEAEIKKALSAGAQGCFIKPVDVDSLLATISVQMRNEAKQPYRAEDV
jgi:DNA-binding response OmpR family regulator